MARYIKTENGFRIYKLDSIECKYYKRTYPTFVCWKGHDEVGNMDFTENETETLTEMVEWCREG